MAGAYWPAAPAAPAAPEAEGVEGGRSSDPSSGRRRRRIISLFAAMRAARRRSYAVSPCVRAREESASRRGGERVSRAHASRRARVERERKRRVARGTGKKEDVGRPARGEGARTHVVGLAGVRHRGARAGARRLRGGSTCACALGCGAGEQPEEYLLSSKTKLSLTPAFPSRLARGAVLSTRRTPPGLPWCPSTRTWSFESGRA